MKDDRPDVPSIGLVTVGLLIVSPAVSPAITLWAGNIGQVPKPYRLIIVAGCFTLLGLAVFWLLRRLLADSRVAAFITFFLLLAVTSSGQVLGIHDWAWGWAAALIAVSLVTLIVLRLRTWRLLDVVVVGSAAALLVPPLLTGAWGTLTNLEGSEVAPSSAASMDTMRDKPDIVLVVVDGYTSPLMLKEIFGYEDTDLRKDLERSGFDVVEPVFSAYSMTHLSVSSLLELGYVAEERLSTVTTDGRTLAQVMGGDSYLVRLLSQNGYRVTMVEPGWHLSTCGDQVDVCVTDRFIDEGVGAVLSQSLLWSFFEPSIGSAFTHGARRAMAWTAENLDELINNGTSDFLFVHVLAPHPPLFLDAACEIVSGDRRLRTTSVNVAGVRPDIAQTRRDGYAQQVQCVNGFVRDVADAVSGSDALVFVTGDHGSDTMSQLNTATAQWSDLQVLERMSVFLAVKPPPTCEKVSSLVTVSLFRSLVSCAGDLGLEPIDEKAFLVSLAEKDIETSEMKPLDADEIATLASCLMSLNQDRSCHTGSD